MSHIAYIGLGSNLDEPIQQLSTALQELNQLANCQLIAQSSLYSSKPVGPQDQPDFVNAVAKLKTNLEPLALLDELQALEQSHRRIRERHWGPRTLDLDLLLYDDDFITHPRLKVPHLHMHERGFVLLPLSEIDPNIELPGKGLVTLILRDIPTDDLQVLTITE